MDFKHGPGTLPSRFLLESWHDLTSACLQVAQGPTGQWGWHLADYRDFFPLFSGWVWILEWNQILTLGTLFPQLHVGVFAHPG